jgi:hypothetical protein
MLPVQRFKLYDKQLHTGKPVEFTKFGTGNDQIYELTTNC